MPRGGLGRFGAYGVDVDCGGWGINDFNCSLWWKSRLGQQRALCVCDLTQEMGAVWADRFISGLSLGYLLGAQPWGQGVEGEEAGAWGLSVGPCLCTYSSPLCTKEPAENPTV